MKWDNEKENLQKLIDAGESYEAIGRLYGCCGNNIKKQCKKLGIKLTSRRAINQGETFNKGEKRAVRFCENCGKELTSKSSKKYCSNKCQQEKRYKEYIDRWKNGEESGISGKYDVSENIRRYMFEKHDCKCEKCGWGEENPKTHQIPLQIHHIDGDCLNNKEENLQLLCPNCHSLTDTYGHSNKTSSRVFRRQKGNI